MAEHSLRSRCQGKARRFCLDYGLLLILIASSGCWNANVPVAREFVPPGTLTDEDQRWVLDSSGLTDTDNERIGSFFEANPDLLESPEWTGQPDKYVAENYSERMRYYWFSGSVEFPTWNVVEFDGWQFHQFTGQGRPDLSNN